MPDNFAIEVSHVSKSFRLPHEKRSSIKSMVLNLYKGRRTFEKQQVLKDITFEVKKGEFFGIVGRNGSGKSTLLKLLSGIYSPDKGSIRINGKLTPFIELGVGFNPELTGRENVYLNGALLGFDRRQMNEMYDDIVDFAELNNFMDQALKNYSSGMQVRLAFSIAIRANSDILILDEVLAVGDEAFQQKCIDVFENYKHTKKTIVLVTHDMEMVKRFCNRALLVNKGKIVDIGSPVKVSSQYSKLNMAKIEQEMEAANNEQKSNIALEIFNSDNVRKTTFTTNDKMIVKMKWPVELKPQNAGIGIYKNSGEYIFGDNTLGEKVKFTAKNILEYQVDLCLGPGKYYLIAGLFGETEREIIDFVSRGPEFIITANPTDKIQGLVRLNSEWKV